MEILTEEEIREVTWEVIDTFLKPRFIELGLNASGETMNSMAARAETNKGIISANASMGAAIYGRKPNDNQDPEAVTNWVKWFAPNVFQPWMDIRGLSGSPYALAYSIAREGSKRYRTNNPSEFLDILKTEEVRSFMLDKFTDRIRVNILSVIKESIAKLKKA